MVQNFLEVSDSVNAFFEKREDHSEEIKKYSDKINPLANVLKLINNTIDPSGVIYDNASSALKKIRLQIGIVSKKMLVKPLSTTMPKVEYTSMQRSMIRSMRGIAR